MFSVVSSCVISLSSGGYRYLLPVFSNAQQLSIRRSGILPGRVRVDKLAER